MFSPNAMCSASLLHIFIGFKDSIFIKSIEVLHRYILYTFYKKISLKIFRIEYNSYCPYNEFCLGYVMDTAVCSFEG